MEINYSFLDTMSVTLAASVGIATLAIVIAAVTLSFFSWTVILLTTTALAIQVLIFATVRHIQLLSLKRNRKWLLDSVSDDRRHDDYHLFVLGSGGHTREMLMMMDDGACDFARFHRRYLMTRGDALSACHVRDYEASLAALCRARGTEPGTHDAVFVRRARRVHQSLATTPWTALLSVFDILPALLSPLPSSQKKNREDVGLPSLVFSNGPATGFFVALAIHLLKMAYLVPEESMRFVYIESWARISSLSITGKLFYFTGLADFLAVQHKQVALKYGIRNVGEIVFNARRDNL